MKSYSPSWKSSIQVRKQRKYVYNAPLHTKHKFLSAHLSKALREKYSKRALPLRKGDEVLVMRGQFKSKKAKVNSVSLSNSNVTLEGIQRTKRDGSKVNLHFNPRNLQIIAVNTDDKKRGLTEVKKEKAKENKNASN